MNTHANILVGGAFATLMIIAGAKWFKAKVIHTELEEEYTDFYNDLNPDATEADISKAVESRLTGQRKLPIKFKDAVIENAVHPLVVAAIIGSLESLTILNFATTVIAIFFLVIYEFYLLRLFLKSNWLPVLLILIWAAVYFIEQESYSIKYTDSPPNTTEMTDTTKASHK